MALANIAGAFNIILHYGLLAVFVYNIGNYHFGMYARVLNKPQMRIHAAAYHTG